jgi:hypothetical protein
MDETQPPDPEIFYGNLTSYEYEKGMLAAALRKFLST